MSVVVVGLEHTRAPLDLLETVTVPERDVAKVISTLRGYGNLHEIVLLSTCLRTEVYAVVDRFHDAVDEITDVIATLSGEAPEALTPKLTIWYDHDVATHLFAVAAGLKSAVPGESEVLGQVKRAWERSREEQVTGPMLDELFRHALQAGKRVRTETGIARGTTSFAHAAAEQAARQLDEGFRHKRVCVVGTGEIGAGVLRALSELDPAAAPTSITVVNRTESNAQAAMGAANLPATYAPLERLADVLGESDVCFSALDTERATITGDMVAQRGGAPLLVVDLGLPRNCDPAVRGVAGISLIDLNDLHLAVDAVKGEREIEAAKAAGIVNDEVHGYRNAARARGAAPVVASLRTRLEALRATELERRRAEFAELSDDEWDKVDSLTRSILAKVMHEPTVVVKDAAGTPRGERLVEALRALFDL